MQVEELSIGGDIGSDIVNRAAVTLMETHHDQVASQARAQRLARHPVFAAGAEPEECAARESRPFNRGSGRGHLPPDPAPEHQRPPLARCRRQGNRHVRSTGRWPPFPSARTAGEAEAFGIHHTHSLHRPQYCVQHPGRGRFSCGNHAAGSLTPARPIPRVFFPSGQGTDRRSDYCGLIHDAADREEAPQNCLRRPYHA